jgi:amino acid transporter
MSSFNIKRVLIGTPFPTSSDIHERLDKIRGLAIFASDPISSNAYATEAIMSVLILISVSALQWTLPIALAVAGLVLLVVFSYIQTILHYPSEGGAYIVTKDNMGTNPSLFAAAALLIDYVLTVSVSSAAGVRAVTSAFPELYDYRVFLALGAIALLTWLNLRGVRESGSIFAIPTYAFIGGVIVVIIIGFMRQYGLFGMAPPTVPVQEMREGAGEVSQFLLVWLVLRAFAAGCTALTGIEAISNGVKAFKPPEARNAAETMVFMAVIAMTLFLGISFLATHFGLVPAEEGESILSQMTRSVVGDGFMYYWVQIFTMLILFLAANTGFQDFPRVSSFMAKDGFMPRWMQNRGDRLVYSGGIVTLAIIASIIVIAFQADEIRMLPLYALGVMLAFTLSQYSMSILMGRIGKLKPGEELHTNVTTVHHESGWRWKLAVNRFGSIVTGIVLVILVVTKFTEGAWVVVVAVPLLVFFFKAVNKHYKDVSEELSTRDLKMEDLAEIADVVIVPLGDVHRGTLRALQYAQRISPNVRAVTICTSEEMRERVERRWMRFPKIVENIELVCIDYDFRDIIEPIVDYIEHVNHVEYPDQIITVVIPEFVPEAFAAQMLHNQTANILRRRLVHHEDVVIIDVPYLIHANSGHEDEAYQPTQMTVMSDSQQAARDASAFAEPPLDASAPESKTE